MTLTRFEPGTEGVGVLTLARGEARNAINTEMLEELLGHIHEARENSELRVLVVTSDDNRGLSAGADVREQLDEAAGVRRMELFSELYEELTAFPRATIAVCHGDCVGGGAEIAVSCDLRVAGDNLRMRFPGAALGVPVGPARLVTLAGLGVAKDLLLTSRTVGAEEALRIGLVHRVAPAAEAESEALALGAEVAAHPAESIGRLKAMLHRHDGIESRTRAEGIAQTDWAKGGAVLPYRDGGDRG